MGKTANAERRSRSKTPRRKYMKKTKLFAIVSIIICTLFAVLASACAHALDVPTGWTIDENLVLSWAGVEDARNYLIEIKN